LDISSVERWIEGRADEMAALLVHLVSIPSENPPGRSLRTSAQALAEAAEGLGLAAEVMDVPPVADLERPAVVRVTAGEGEQTVYFHGHFDVVPAQSSDQFNPVRADGRITGRGTADMKGGLVSMLYAAAAAHELKLLGDGQVVLHFVCDEETGSVGGSGYLQAQELIDPAALAMVTAEPTGGDVWHASRGAITMRVTVAGREAHVGQAHRGDNAYVRMARIAEPLGELAQRLLERRTAFPLDDPDGGGSMLVVGGAAGAGTSFNVVPGSAWFAVDRRFNPEEDLDEELALLTETIENAAADAGSHVTIEVLQAQPSANTDPTGPVAEALTRSITLAGVAPRMLMCPGVLDIRWYAQLGIPAFAHGPGRLDVSHGPQEFVDEHAVQRAAVAYALFAGDLLG
jgi:acetylornithine deacetylase/succinyl-diaminopimelate desuccinylase-like protein